MPTPTDPRSVPGRPAAPAAGPPVITPAQAVRRLGALLRTRPGRIILGIAGAPGAGKTSYAAALVAEQPDSVPTVLVGMDAFHLAHSSLTSLGTVEAKGAPGTFDADGYAALLRRIRVGEPRTIWAPEFRRELEDAIGGAVAVEPGTRLVITEGNYLLLEDPRWVRVRPLLDEVWYVQVPEKLRIERLVARHMKYGRPAADAWERVAHGTDARNAALVAATRGAADVIVQLEPEAPPGAGPADPLPGGLNDPTLGRAAPPDLGSP